MAVTQVVSPTQGLVGYLHEVECKSNDSILVFQLPRTTNNLSDVYKQGAIDAVIKILPEGRSALVIGCDIDIYELAGEDALILKLKGLI